MEYDLQFKIYNDKKQAKYLKENSWWYKELNRTPDSYQAFIDEFKKQNRKEQTDKINSAIETLDTVNHIFKIIN